MRDIFRRVGEAVCKGKDAGIRWAFAVVAIEALGFAAQTLSLSAAAENNPALQDSSHEVLNNMANHIVVAAVATYLTATAVSALCHGIHTYRAERYAALHPQPPDIFQNLSL